jgi:large subunit ribosomal protein L30
MLEITYRRSAIGRPQRQRRTLAALGLRKLQHSVRREDSPTTRGMIAKVQHLVSWREVDESETE